MGSQGLHFFAVEENKLRQARRDQLPDKVLPLAGVQSRREAFALVQGFELDLAINGGGNRREGIIFRILHDVVGNVRDTRPVEGALGA